MNEHYAFFDFDEARYLVKYKSDKDIGDQIEDAISSLTDDGALDKVHTTSDELLDYEKFVHSVMDSFNVEWEFVPVRRYWI